MGQLDQRIECRGVRVARHRWPFATAAGKATLLIGYAESFEHPACGAVMSDEDRSVDLRVEVCGEWSITS